MIMKIEQQRLALKKYFEARSFRTTVRYAVVDPYQIPVLNGKQATNILVDIDTNALIPSGSVHQLTIDGHIIDYSIVDEASEDVLIIAAKRLEYLAKQLREFHSKI